jgi:hypothetical protein
MNDHCVIVDDVTPGIPPRLRLRTQPPINQSHERTGGRHVVCVEGGLVAQTQSADFSIPGASYSRTAVSIKQLMDAHRLE